MVSLSYNIDDKNWQESFPLFKKYISKSVIETIKTVKVNLSENSEISFLLTSDKKIQKLNYKYRNKNFKNYIKDIGNLNCPYVCTWDHNI